MYNVISFTSKYHESLILPTLHKENVTYGTRIFQLISYLYRNFPACRSYVEVELFKRSN